MSVPPRRPTRYVRLADLEELAREVQRLDDRISRAIDQHYDTLMETVQFVNALQVRLLIVDVLPAEAPMGALIRRTQGTIPERASLYLGNGPGQPLSRLVPTSL